MPTHVAFLRGMNVGGHRVTNADLCASIEALGFTDVAAFLASGNVVFTATGAPDAVRKRVEVGLQEALGYAVPTFIRGATQVRAITKHDPFGARDGAQGRGKLQVMFLRHRPSVKAVAAACSLGTCDDWLAVQGRELYWLPRGGVSDSELDMKAVVAAVGEPTVRTMNTVGRLVAKFFT